MAHTSLGTATAAPIYQEGDFLPHGIGDICWLELQATEIVFCQVRPEHWSKSLSFRTDESRGPVWAIGGSSNCTVSGYGVADDGTGTFNPPNSTFVDNCLDPNLPAGSLCASFWQFGDLPVDSGSNQITERLWKHLFAKTSFLGADASIVIPRGARYLALSINCSYAHYASNSGSAYIAILLASLNQ